MNRSLRWNAAALLAALLAGASAARAQQTPHVGYAFPAGGKQGTSFEITVGGQYLGGVNEVLVSGKGVQAKVIKYTKPISRKQLNDLSKKLKEMRDLGKQGGKKGGKAQPTRAQFVKAAEEFELFAKKLGLENFDLKTFAELRKKLTDPKRQPNPQIEETVTLHVTVAPEAAPGDRELRLRTSLGLTNPLMLRVGQYPECFEKEPNDEAGGAIEELLPVVLNGQIAPGDVDRFRFRATKGSRLVAA
ncbi:MAG TPA: hypothetical protein VM695_14705, partial [Phycisphaerae bacterium]|nr:hypothetical protein [Phycisphaerae bacterium]